MSLYGTLGINGLRQVLLGTSIQDAHYNYIWSKPNRPLKPQKCEENTKAMPQLPSTTFPRHQKKAKWGTNNDKTNTAYEVIGAWIKKSCNRWTASERSVEKLLGSVIRLSVVGLTMFVVATIAVCSNLWFSCALASDCDWLLCVVAFVFVLCDYICVIPWYFTVGINNPTRTEHICSLRVRQNNGQGVESV